MSNGKLSTNSYLSFKLGDEIFATNVLKVQEILQMTKITKVPQSPSYMLGVINRHGTVLPVIDTSEKFKLEEHAATVNTCIIVLSIEIDNETLLVGALVDAVLEVFEVEDRDIKPAPTLGNKYKSEIIHGVVKMDDHFVMILNMDKVLSSDELIIVKETSDTTVPAV
jgi:purine-binding chemotaxis protein CheW